MNKVPDFTLIASVAAIFLILRGTRVAMPRTVRELLAQPLTMAGFALGSVALVDTMIKLLR